MVKINEHKEKMESIKSQAEKSKGQKKKQLLKCYHRMKKELAEAYRNLGRNQKKCQI